MKKGIIQIYTGDGKGKTTAAFGQALRAAGQNMKVVIIQFLKGSETGELVLEKAFPENISIHRYNSQKKFVWNMTDSEKELLKEETKEGFFIAKKILSEAKFDMVILDEVLGAMNNGYISEEELIGLMDSKATGIELILTGRGATKRLMERANLVTEMRMIKHHMNEGMDARKGIEF